MANDFFVGAASGDASVAGNYSPPSVPVNTDNLYFGALGVSSVSVGFGLAALAGVTLGTLSIASTYTGSIGLGPQVTFNITAATETGSGPTTLVFTTNAAHGYVPGDTIVVTGVSPSGYNGTLVVTASTSNTFTAVIAGTVTSYVSGGTAQRVAAFEVGAGICRIGDSSLSGTAGSGSGRLVLDFLTTAAACTVISTASAGLDIGLEPVRLKFNSSSASLSVESGLVGIATSTPADTSTIGAINVSGQSATVDVGPGVTFTTLQTNQGTTNVYAGGGTSKIYSGNLNFLGNALLTAVYCYGGTVTLSARPSSGATVTDLYLYGGTLDLTGNPSPLTITNLHFRDGNIKQAYVGQLTITTFILDLTDKTNFNGARS